jgi:hypothetical protein
VGDRRRRVHRPDKFTGQRLDDSFRSRCTIPPSFLAFAQTIPPPERWSHHKRKHLLLQAVQAVLVVAPAHHASSVAAAPRPGVRPLPVIPAARSGPDAMATSLAGRVSRAGQSAPTRIPADEYGSLRGGCGRGLGRQTIR